MLRLVVSNRGARNDLGGEGIIGCPHSCPNVEVSMDLARFVVAWQDMSAERKRCLAEFAKV